MYNMFLKKISLMRKKIILIALITINSLFVNAQRISGVVTDNEQKPMTGTTVSLLKATDSTIIKLAATQKDGSFSFPFIKAGKYIVAATHINYKKVHSPSFDFDSLKDYKLPAITLAPQPKGLAEVTITSKRPIIEVKADKTILNVEGTINSVGSDAFELLKKSPGVQVDKDDNLSLSGKNGVQIYIDGRPSPLSGKDLAEYLKSIHSSEIESIELITNPSAKYEAAGNAGIINIKFKKNKALGTNGSVNAGYNIGVYSKYNAGISLNHRNKKINVFGNYNYNNSKVENYANLNRLILDTLFDQKNTIIVKPVVNTFKAGLDYFINKKNILGILINGNLADGTVNSNSKTPISYYPTSAITRILDAGSSSSFKRDNLNANANYRYTDTSGRELNMDANYGMYKIRTNQVQPNYYYDATGTNELSRYIYNMIAPNDINIYSFKTDYEQKFKKGKLGIGGKLAYVDSKNDFQRYNVFTNGKLLDTLKSNNFRYTENINALYINYNKAYKGFIIQAGVRMENTFSKGHSTGYKKLGNGNYANYDSTFKRNYTDFFPSFAITFNKNPKSQWSISYSRRIDRPTYQNLNPFEFKLDEYTYSKGNTELTPQYTSGIKLSNTYKYKLTTQLSYSHTRDVFAQITDTAEKTKAFITQKNLATQDNVGLNISYPFQIKWYSAFININSYYSHYKANLGTGRSIDLDVFTTSIYMQNGFKLGKGWTGELSGFFNSPSLYQGTFKLKAIGGIDAGIQKSILKGKGTLKASVSDILKTQVFTATSNFVGQRLVATGGSDSRQFRINFSYRFGSMQVKAARQRKTGAEEESERVKTQ